MWYGIKWKYMFMFRLNNIARKGLRVLPTISDSVPARAL